MSYNTLADIPTAERNQLSTLRDEYERLTGYAFTVQDGWLVAFANQGQAMNNLTDFASQIWAQNLLPQDWKGTQPWLQFGMDHADYQSLATTFGSEYKKLTGQDIPPDQLTNAFQTSQRGAGGLLTGTEYAQQLMQDTTLQKQYGWIKYGLDYNQWTGQKLQMRQGFGRDIQDSEATSLLQYTHAAQGGGHEVRAASQGQQSKQPAAAGASQSVIR